MTSDFRDFIEKLEKEGELHRVKEEVDPNLEITEIAIKAQKENKPALLFENVRGSRYPLAINSFASAKRIRIALGQEPEEIGVELLNFVESLKPPSLKNIFTHRKTVKRLLSFRPTKTRKSPVHEESSESLGELPILKCWPDDGGNFITLPLVQTKDLITGIPNLGIYRMQIHDHLSTGMHMQIGKGGGYHYWEAEKQSKELPVAVTLGGDPVLTIAAIMALPEGIGELEFAGMVRGSRTKLSRCKTIDMYAPSTGEFLLEGVLKPNQRKLEGPFGDHFGHYSAAGNYPVFNINKIFHFARADLTFISYHLKINVQNINCTKIKSKLARTYTDRHSLKDLIKEFVGIDVSKQHQASDFGGELSQAQLKYCANDVIYLHKINDALDKILIRENRMKLYEDTIKFIQTRVDLDLASFKEDIWSH